MSQSVETEQRVTKIDIAIAIVIFIAIDIKNIMNINNIINVMIICGKLKSTGTD